MHYQHIAQYGYFDPFPGIDPASDNRVAFFPGFPLVLRAVHTVVPDGTVARLLISLVSGAVAVVALARIAGLGRPDGAPAGQRAAGFLLLSPAAVFLAAAITVEFLLARDDLRGRRRLRSLLWWCAAPAVPATAYTVYLHAHTGEFQVELLAMAVGVLLLLLLLHRRWPEVGYIGLSLWALGTSYRYLSIPGATSGHWTG